MTQLGEEHHAPNGVIANIQLQERVFGKLPPADWASRKLHSIFRVKKRNRNIGLQEKNLLSLSYGRIIPKDIESSVGLLPESFETYQIVEPGDIVLRLTDLQNDKKSLRQGLVTEKGIVTSAYDAVSLTDQDEPRFWFYFLYALDIFKYYYSLGGGVRQSIKFEDFPNELVFGPSLTLQQRIASFLDRETAKIRELIEKKQRLVELLKEKRSAVITQAVTKGLDPSSPMKDSGIEWLGQIPAHWLVSQVKRKAVRIQTGSTPSTNDEHYYENGTVAWYGPGSFTDALPLSSPVKLLSDEAVLDGAARVFAPGSTMIVTIGATIGKVAYLDKPGSCNQQITGITFDSREVVDRFAAYQLKSLEPTLKGIAPSTTLPIMDQNEVGYLPLALPPYAEQRAIAAYLDKATNLFDRLVFQIEGAVLKLEEYRSALISAAVTGQIDVRDEVGAT